jgi:hypothetical protein
MFFGVVSCVDCKCFEIHKASENMRISGRLARFGVRQLAAAFFRLSFLERAAGSELPPKESGSKLPHSKARPPLDSSNRCGKNSMTRLEHSSTSSGT